MTEAVSRQKSRAVALAQQFANGVAAVDAAALTAVLHPDVEVHEPTTLPYGGVYRGRDAFFNGLMQAVVSNFEVGVEDGVRIFDGGDRAAAQMTMIYTSRTTGQAIHMPYVEVYSVKADLIHHIAVYPQDSQVLAEFMNANSTPSPA